MNSATDVTPGEAKFEPANLGFSTDPAEIAREAEFTLETIDRLKSAPRNPLVRARAIAMTTLTFGEQPVSKLPAAIRAPAEAYRFVPVTRTLSGTPPLLFHHVPFYADPTGLALMSVYSTYRWYLHTYFEDGSAVCTAVKESGNANTEAHVSHDLEHGYPDHMRAVKAYQERTGLKPLVRPTAEHIRKGWSIYLLYQIPPVQALILLVMDLVLLVLVVWFVVATVTMLAKFV